jgi:hypothetical protein
VTGCCGTTVWVAATQLASTCPLPRSRQAACACVVAVRRVDASRLVSAVVVSRTPRTTRGAGSGRPPDVVDAFTLTPEGRHMSNGRPLRSAPAASVDSSGSALRLASAGLWLHPFDRRVAIATCEHADLRQIETHREKERAAGCRQPVRFMSERPVVLHVEVK